MISTRTTFSYPVLTVLGRGNTHSVHGSPRRSDPKGMHVILTKEKK
jgi:hypothetical protein